MLFLQTASPMNFPNANLFLKPFNACPSPSPTTWPSSSSLLQYPIEQHASLGARWLATWSSWARNQIQAICKLSCTCGNGGSFTHCASPGMESISQHSHFSLIPLHHRGNSSTQVQAPSYSTPLSSMLPDTALTTSLCSCYIPQTNTLGSTQPECCIC